MPPVSTVLEGAIPDLSKHERKRLTPGGEAVKPGHSRKAVTDGGDESTEPRSSSPSVMSNWRKEFVRRQGKSNYAHSEMLCSTFAPYCS